MSKRYLVTAGIVLVALCALLGTMRTDAGVIARSRSNICNNRMAAPIGGAPTNRFPSDAVVLCDSCGYPPATPDEGCLILMDNQTGEIWAYCDDAFTDGKPPRYLGKLTAVGESIVKDRK